nr:putative zinc finger, CCHC-type, retrotransposon Gag domain protein [Tanacetum cinerariifolium]
MGDFAKQPHTYSNEVRLVTRKYRLVSRAKVIENQNVGNNEANDTVTVVSSVVDESVAKNSGSNDVKTPTVNMEKPMTPNMGAHINDTANIEVSDTSNLTHITSASILKSVSFTTKLKFSSKDGLDAMMENGPWFFRNNPYILKRWNPDVDLQKKMLVMAILVISISSDSSEDSMGTPAGRAKSNPSEDPSSGHIPPLPATSPFLSSDDDTTDSDTPDTPPSPTHDTPFTEITASTQRSPVIPHHSSPDLQSTSAGPSRKRRRSPMTSIPVLPLVSGALSPIRADLIPPPKRVRDIGYLADVEDDPRETKVEREGAAEVTYETLGDLVQRFHDHTQAISVHRIQTTEGIQRAGTKMPNTRSRASMTHKDVEELITRRVAEEIEAREVARNLEALNENEEEQEGENGGNKGNENGGNENRGNGGNGNEGNGNHGMNYGGFVPMARECTFQDFLKCKPHAFSGTEGVVGLTCWFEKMETVFNISNFPPKYQVKYATGTLQNSALTWWNSHKRTIGVDVAYALK